MKLFNLLYIIFLTFFNTSFSCSTLEELLYEAEQVGITVNEHKILDGYRCKACKGYFTLYLSSTKNHIKSSHPDDKRIYKSTGFFGTFNIAEEFFWLPGVLVWTSSLANALKHYNIYQKEKAVSKHPTQTQDTFSQPSLTTSTVDNSIFTEFYSNMEKQEADFNETRQAFEAICQKISEYQ